MEDPKIENTFPAKRKFGEQGIDFITSKDFDHSSNNSEFPTQKMKTEVKTEVKEEPFATFEASEQGGIDFITSKDFDQNVNESEFPTQKIDFAIKRKIRKEPDESNVPLKKSKQIRLVNRSTAIGEEFDTNIQGELQGISWQSEQSNLALLRI